METDDITYKTNYEEFEKNSIEENLEQEKEVKEKENKEEIIIDLKDFSKIIIDFLNDLILAYPELKDKLNEDLLLILNNEDDKLEDIELSIKNIYNYIKNTYPLHFFKILYKNDEIFTDNTLDFYFLPDIKFSLLWDLKISDTNKNIIWKYTQLLLFSVISDVKTDSSFGDSAQLFEAISQDEFKNKLNETFENFQNMFDSPETDISSNTNLPDPEAIHEHINQLMNGKLGQLAKEIAEETAANLDIDTENIKDVGDVFQKLFKNPNQLMNIVKDVGSKLDSKMKNGDLKESELIQEATEMMNKMQNMPGMNKMQDIFNKLNIPNANKFNKNAFDSMMSKNLKSAKMKERMKTKLDEKKERSKSSCDEKPNLENLNNDLMEL